MQRRHRKKSSDGPLRLQGVAVLEAAEDFKIHKTKASH
jgi:hypothetical protein